MRCSLAIPRLRWVSNSLGRLKPELRTSRRKREALNLEHFSGSLERANARGSAKLLNAAARNAVRETSRFSRGISPQEGSEKSCIETIPRARGIYNVPYTEGGDKMLPRAKR